MAIRQTSADYHSDSEWESRNCVKPYSTFGSNSQVAFRSSFRVLLPALALSLSRLQHFLNRQTQSSCDDNCGAKIPSSERFISMKICHSQHSEETRKNIRTNTNASHNHSYTHTNNLTFAIAAAAATPEMRADFVKNPSNRVSRRRQRRQTSSSTTRV